jgi:hypothetical protein
VWVPRTRSRHATVQIHVYETTEPIPISWQRSAGHWRTAGECGLARPPRRPTAGPTRDDNQRSCWPGFGLRLRASARLRSAAQTPRHGSRYPQGFGFRLEGRAQRVRLPSTRSTPVGTARPRCVGFVRPRRRADFLHSVGGHNDGGADRQGSAASAVERQAQSSTKILRGHRDRVWSETWFGTGSRRFQQHHRSGPGWTSNGGGPAAVPQVPRCQDTVAEAGASVNLPVIVAP